MYVAGEKELVSSLLGESLHDYKHHISTIRMTLDRSCCGLALVLSPLDVGIVTVGSHSGANSMA